MAEKKT